MLNFFNGIQDRYLLLVCFLVTMGLYTVFTVDAILQLMINFAVAIIAISKRPSTSTSAETIETVNVGGEDAQKQ